MNEIEDIAREWAKRNERILLREQNKMRIGRTQKLRRSMSSFTKRIGSNVETGNVFLRRRAKKWYSPTFYGRLNALQGVVQAEVNEQIIKKIRGAHGNQRG